VARDRDRRDRRDREEDSGLIDKVIHINRVAKVVKGGRRFSFSALIVVGDGQGNVGAALGKANSMFRVPIVDGTIPHEVLGHYGAGQVLLKPASAGTGVIAGGAVRAILEAAGVHNILTKCIGSNNPHNVVHATVTALQELSGPDEVATRRGIPADEMHRRHVRK